MTLPPSHKQVCFFRTFYWQQTAGWQEIGWERGTTLGKWPTRDLGGSFGLHFPRVFVYLQMLYQLRKRRTKHTIILKIYSDTDWIDPTPCATAVCHKRQWFIVILLHWMPNNNNNKIFCFNHTLPITIEPTTIWESSSGKNRRYPPC